MVAVVGLTYETMFSTLSTYGLSRTQHSHNIQQAAPSAMISSPTVRVEEIDGCSSNGGRARPADDFHGVHGPDPESCGRARSTREVAHLLRRWGGASGSGTKRYVLTQFDAFVLIVTGIGRFTHGHTDGYDGLGLGLNRYVKICMCYRSNSVYTRPGSAYIYAFIYKAQA